MKFTETIKLLLAAENPLHITQEGLERIAEIARNNKGALFLFDSIAKFNGCFINSTGNIWFKMFDISTSSQNHNATQYY